MELCNVGRTNLKRGIRQAKLDCKNKIEDHLHSSNLRHVRQGVQNIIKYKPRSNTVDGNATLVEGLNCFFTHFKDTPEAATSQPHLHSEGAQCQAHAKDSKPQKSSGT